MYYFKHNEGGEWKMSKLSGPEVDKVRQITIVECIKSFKHIAKTQKAAEEKLGVKADPRIALEIFRKVAPTYDSIALDFIRNQIRGATAKKQAEPAQT